jgi:hypothetical protein
MPSENPNTNSPVLSFEIVQPKEGIARVYANGAKLTWTGSDLTAHLYQIVQPDRDIPSQKDDPNQLLHSASVTLTWYSAKIFYGQLGEAIERYEKAYGAIRTEYGAI